MAAFYKGLDGAPELTEAPRPIVIEGKGQKLQWRPGRAVIEAKEVNQQEVLAALTDFAFFEGELRDLEAALHVREADVHTDVRRAYSMRYSDRRHWPRFTEMIQCFSGMRFTYAQLEPWLIKGARNLPDASRGWFARLLRKAQVDPRLEEFSNRLEACEDLYEGAHDRINDFLGYFYGHLLEVAIVIFLVAEVAIGGAELWMHVQEYLHPEKDDPTENKITPPINKEPQTAALDDVPKELLDIVRKRYPGTEPSSAKKGIEKGDTFFEVSIRPNGEDITVTLTLDGQIEEISKEIDDHAVPQVVKNAARSQVSRIGHRGTRGSIFRR